MWHYCKRQKFEDPEPLKKIAERSLISNLGFMADSITSRFSCGGKLNLPLDRTISVVYKTTVQQCSSLSAAKEAEVMWSSIEFPGADQTAMGKLLDACIIAIALGTKKKV